MKNISIQNPIPIVLEVTCTFESKEYSKQSSEQRLFVVGIVGNGHFSGNSEIWIAELLVLKGAQITFHTS